MNNIYSLKIANEICSYLDEEDWNYSFDDEKGNFYFTLLFNSVIKNIFYKISVDEDDYNVYAMLPIGVDVNNPEMVTKMTEFVCRANYGLKSGNYEFDIRDGTIRFKTFVDCIEGIIPDKKIIEASIYRAAAMIDRYITGIIEIIFGDTTAEKAVDKCENDLDELKKLFEEISTEDDE